ncbi:hypothetical protein BH10PSE1_BH10PSE1_28210 [soil metagenome]
MTDTTRIRPLSLPAMWDALKATEIEYDAACVIEDAALRADGVGSGTARIDAATARADGFEARMSAIITAMRDTPVTSLADLAVKARLAASRSDDRLTCAALARDVLAFTA